ncbi:alpha/beta fold hydrolase [Clostridium sp. 'White wine YQ']|uniref:alpha/beta fold hydrolase n=1 Tax=Clostridium sp. 'White wine YQ' TaxID=3027474 RepID=UPI00236522EF|nr:alpha/beta hydrolase [Clostridium sp. 'White wine YQ']MDD7794274.1 alpha/beta hydrolase [Clostridium sp. 'White wine YQ']
MGKKIDKLIYLEEYVLVNGIKQYLFHSGTSYDNPVMLFLHGGPGNAESIFAYAFQDKWEDIFTVVHWDQRGAGKTLIKNPDKHPNIDLLLMDLNEIIQYLKKKYNKQKIILLGHSWGSVLGSTFIKKYPKDVAYYIGVGQVISMRENERVGYDKVKELIISANDKKSLKKIEAIKNYPGDKYDSEFMKKCIKLRRLQGKYDLAVKIGLSMTLIAFKSPISKLSDFSALLKGNKANEKIISYLFNFDLNSETAEYKVPIYYVLGENDWQTPYVIAKRYFENIKSPYKKLYLIPNAGHMTMLDQPELFYNALIEINNQEK